MSLQPQELNASFVFGSFFLDPRERRLTRDGEVIRLTPKAFDVLLVLVARAGHLVTKEDLLKEVWSDAFVEEGNLSYTVSLLRKALEVDPRSDGYIATVQKVGYRFIAPVHTADELSDTVPQSSQAAFESTGTPRSTQHDRSRLSTRELAYATAIATALGIAALAAIAYLRRPTPSPSSPAAHLEIVLPPNVEDGKEPSISPDGRFLVMTAVVNGRTQLVVRRLDSTTLSPLAGTEHGWLPIWSADSRSVAFLQGRKLRRIELSGGQPTDVCDVAQLAGGDWNRDGVILFGDAQANAIYRAPAGGGLRQAVTSPDSSRGETSHRWPHFLPDGQHFLYTIDGTEGGVYVGALDRPIRKRVVADGRGGQYVRGYILFLRAQTLMAQRFDLRSLDTQGEPMTIVDGVGLGSITGSGFSASTDGSIVYRPAQPDSTQLVWFGRDGSRLAVAGPPGSYRQVALSRLGHQVAVSRRDPATGNLDIHTLDLSTGVISRQTTERSFEGDPIWSPDERALLFSSNRTHWMRPFRKDLDTGKEEALLENEEANVYVEDWTSDGRFIVIRSQDAWYAVPTSRRGTPRHLAARPPGGDQLRVSPMGECVAFESTESDQSEVYVATFPQFLNRRKVSLNGGTQPVWRRDGRQLFYLTLKGVLTAVESDGNAQAGRHQSRALFTTSLLPTAGLDEYATVDGQRFLFIEKKSQTITILMNWMESRTR